MTSGEGRRPLAHAWDTLRHPDPVRVVDVLQNAKTVLAGVVAWVLATSVLGLEQAFLAPWAAVLVVHATVFRTVSRAGQQVTGTFLGVFLAWFCSLLLDPAWLAMALMLGLAFCVGIIPWMRDEGTNVATTGIVVVATNAVAQSNLLWSRLIDTAVGIGVGLVINLLVWPPLRDRAAWSRVRGLPGELGEVLQDIADKLSPDLDGSVVDGWVRQLRIVDVHVDEAWGLLRQAQESARFNPRRSAPGGLQEMADALHLVEQAIADSLSTVRTIATSAENSTVWNESFRAELVRMLAITAAAAHEADAEKIRAVHDELRAVAERFSRSDLLQTAWHEYGGMLMNLRNIARALADVAAWVRDSSQDPKRTRRFDVPSPPLRPAALTGRGRIRRVSRGRRGYVADDERANT